MLTKSLHTITAATRVAAYILKYHGPENYSTPTSAWQLAYDALDVLGHPCAVASVEGTDETVRKVREACAKLLRSI